ncbi:MAG TPA: hypothetical protein VI818_06645, partial [Candidatus Thermoplasmatota archaeon]|nr:hypothetical protein [Candidatus Thermoplasmatota archaeon]
MLPMLQSRTFVVLLMLALAFSGCLENRGTSGAPNSASTDQGTPTSAAETPATPDPTDEPAATETPSEAPEAPAEAENETEAAPPPPPAPVAVALITSASPTLQVQDVHVFFEVKAPLTLDAKESTSGVNLTSYFWD